MLEFRLSKVKAVSLAGRFMTLTGPSSLVLLTTELQRRGGEKRRMELKELNVFNEQQSFVETQHDTM